MAQPGNTDWGRIGFLTFGILAGSLLCWGIMHTMQKSKDKKKTVGPPKA